MTSPAMALERASETSETDARVEVLVIVAMMSPLSVALDGAAFCREGSPAVRITCGRWTVRGSSEVASD